MSEKPVLTPAPKVPELSVQYYERYNPTAFNDSLTILEKMNKMIFQINQLGFISNDIVGQWTKLIEWILGDGLNEIVSEEIQKKIDDGTFNNLFDSLLGSLADLETIDKSTIVAAINEVNRIAIKNKEGIGDVTELNTQDKSNLVNALNEIQKQTDMNRLAPIMIAEATGHGIISGFKVTQQPVLSMGINIGNTSDINIVHMKNGDRYELSSISLPVDDASPTLYRKDIVYVSKTGVIEYQSGVPNTETLYVPPVEPIGSELLAIINVVPNDTTINNVDITDKRELKALKFLKTKNQANLVQAINEVVVLVEDAVKDLLGKIDDVVDTIGDLNNLPTTDKTSIVNAFVEFHIAFESNKVVVTNALNAITTNIGLLSELKTDDKDNIVEAINWLQTDLNTKIGLLLDLETTDKASVVGAINELFRKSSMAVSELIENIGDLTELNTQDKTNLVNAINELNEDLIEIVRKIRDEYATKIELGDLNLLKTLVKSSAIGAINENWESIKILKNITGYNVSVAEFGADGKGTNDDTDSIQNAFDFASLNKKVVVFPPGIYNISGTVLVTSGAKGMVGIGDVRINQNGTNYIGFRFEDLNSFSLENIQMSGDLLNEIPAMWFERCELNKITNCRFINTGSTCISLSKTKNTVISKCYFKNTGMTAKTNVLHPSKPAIWVGEAPTYLNKNVTISECEFDETIWSGVYFFPYIGTIENCVFNKCGESSIFVDYHPFDIKIVNNVIDGAKAVNIAGFGIELGGVTRCLIAGNIITNCDEAGIALATMYDYTIVNNKCLNNGKGNGTLEQKAGIVFRLVSGDCIRGTVANNILTDTKSTGKTQLYGISTFRYGVNVFYVASTIFESNVMDGNSTKPLFLTDEVSFLGDNNFFTDNIGYAATPKTVVMKTGINSGVKRIEGFGFRPRSIKIEAFSTTHEGSKCTSEIVRVGNGIANNVSEYGGKFKVSTLAWSILDAEGNITNYAEISGFTNDGFIVNNGYTGEDIELFMTAYP